MATTRNPTLQCEMKLQRKRKETIEVAIKFLKKKSMPEIPANHIATGESEGCKNTG